METREIVENVLQVLKGAEVILKGEEVEIEEKSGVGNIVTSVDKKMEEFLSETLSNLFPDATIIGEEAADSNAINEASESGLKFVIDPLDGTTNYTNGWPHTVSIGIINDNDIVAGVIYDVLNDKVYVGIKDSGVFQCNMDDILNPKDIVKPEYLQENIKKAVISYDTPYGAEAFKFTTETVARLYHTGASLKTVGPISLDVLKTALGKENRPHDYNCAVFHAEVRAWDLCAATCILREFGGEIIGMDGNPLSAETLSNPNARIAFIASGNKTLLNTIYTLVKN